MSDNSIKLEVIEVIDPVLNLEHSRKYGVYNAGSEIQYSRFDSQSSTNTSQVTIVCNPPNVDTIIHPQITQSVPINISFTGDAGVGNKLFASSYGITDAPRAFPLAQIQQSLAMTWNGYAITTNLNEYLNAFLRYNNYVWEFDSKLSTSPSMLDQFQEYADGIGSTRNPLANYLDNSTQVPRGGFNIFVISDTQFEANIILTVIEPLMVSPSIVSKSGFRGISTLTVQMVLANLNRVWSQTRNSLMTIKSVIPQTISMLFKYITPKMTENIPKELVYPYHDVQVLSTTSNGFITGGSSFQLNINATNLSSVPQRIYLCCRQSTNTLTSKDTDTFAQINKVVVQWDNRSGLLSSAQQSDLFEMSRQAGLNYSWTQWNNYIGSVLCIEVAKQIGMSSTKSVGVLSNPQFSAQVFLKSLKDPLSAPIQMQLFAIVVYEGCFNIRYGKVDTDITPLSNSDVLNAELNPSLEIVGKQSENFYGGDFMEEINKIIPHIKTGIDIVKLIGGKRKPHEGYLKCISQKEMKRQEIKKLKAQLNKMKKKKKGASLIGGGNLQIEGGQTISRKKLQENYDDLNDESDTDSDYE